MKRILIGIMSGIALAIATLTAQPEPQPVDNAYPAPVIGGAVSESYPAPYPPPDDGYPPPEPTRCHGWGDPCDLYATYDAWGTPTATATRPAPPPVGTPQPTPTIGCPADLPCPIP